MNMVTQQKKWCYEIGDVVYPCQKAFESFGFRFLNQEGKNYILLPEGWQMTDGITRKEILDSQGRTRACIFVSSSPSLIMYCRYILVTLDDYVDGDIIVKDIGYDTIYHRFSYHRWKENDYESAQKEATAYLDTNYPQWKDPLAYWDDRKENK